MGFNLNPLHDIKEAANDAIGATGHALNVAAHSTNDALSQVGLGAGNFEQAGRDALQALNMPLQTVQHMYRTEHEVWTRYGVGAFLDDNTWRLLGGALDKNLDPELNRAWSVTGNGGTGVTSFATSNPNYRDIHGNAVNPGYDLANIIDHVVNGRRYVPNGWHLDRNGVMQPDVDPVTGRPTGGIDFFSGAVNAVFDLSLDPLMVAGKVGKAAKEGGVVIGAGKALFGGKTVILSSDAAERAGQLADIARHNPTAPVSITADGKKALIGGRVLAAGRVPKLLVDEDGTRASNIPFLVANNPAVHSAFSSLAKVDSTEKLIESYPALGYSGVANELVKANTVQQVSDVFERALTVRNYGFLQHGLPTTSLTRRMAYRVFDKELPTSAAIGSKIADSNPLFRTATSYRPHAIQNLELNSRTYDPNDPSFLKPFRDSLLAAGQDRKTANAILAQYIETPDLGTRINMITRSMGDALRERGLPDDSPLLQKYGKFIDFLNKNTMRRVYGMDTDGKPLYLEDPETGEPLNFGIYKNQIGKVALPDYNEIREALAGVKRVSLKGDDDAVAQQIADLKSQYGKKSVRISPDGKTAYAMGDKSYGLGGKLVRADEWIYNHYTSRIFKNLVLLSLGFGLRVASGELVPAILQNDFKTTLGSGLESAAAKLNPTLKDLSDEYGHDALIGKSARVRGVPAGHVAMSDIANMGSYDYLGHTMEQASRHMTAPAEIAAMDEAVGETGFTQKRYDDMLNSVRQNGIQEPLVVEVSGDGERHFLRDGHHRYLAAKRAGLDSVPVRFHQDLPRPSDLKGDEPRTGRIVAINPDDETITVKHNGGTHEYAYNEATILQRDIKDAHIMRMARKMGIDVTRQEVPHIRAALGVALHGVGAALVDEDYYDTALRNILSLDGHLIAPAVSSNHDLAMDDVGAAAQLSEHLKQAGAHLPENPSRLGREFTPYDSGLDSHPVFWNYAIHEAAKDKGAALAAKAYKDALERGASREEAFQAFVDQDLNWIKHDPSEDAEQFRTNMALISKDPEAFARLRAKSMEGLTYGKNGELNKDVLAALAGDREVPTIADLADPARAEARPTAVKGRVIEAIVPPSRLDRITAFGWRRALHPVINGMSRAPIYTMLTTKEYKFLKPWVDAGLMDAQEAHQISQVRAANRMLPLIHNTKLRSQMSDLTRNFFPFYFAQEQAYKRYGRVILHDPAALRKALLAAHGITTSGAMRSDADGNNYMVLPGGSLYAGMVTGALTGMGYSAMSGLPSTISGNTISLRSVIPEGNLPSVSPLAAISLEEIEKAFPNSEPALSKLVGPINSSESVTEQLIPNATIKRLIQASSYGERSSAFASAYMNNMAAANYRANLLNDKADAAEAAGNMAQARTLRRQANQFWPPADADPTVKQDVLRRIKSATRIQMYMKALIGAVSPLSPVLETGDLPIKAEVQQYMKKYGVSDGLDKFLTKRPDATAYTVFLSDNRSTGTAPPATEAALAWIDRNKGWISRNKLAAAYLIPQTAQQFDLDAYNSELADGLRARRDPGTGDAEQGSMVQALYSAATDSLYYPSLNAYENAMKQAQGDTLAQQQLTQSFDAYEQQLATSNPIWDANRPKNNSQAILVAKIALGQLSDSISNGEAPDSPQVGVAKDLITSWQTYQQTIQAIKLGEITDLSQTDAKAQFNSYLDSEVEQNPAASALVSGIFRKLVNADG